VRAVRSVLKTAGPEATLASTVGPKRKVRFVLQEPDRDGHDGPKGAASGLKRSNHHQSASTMRSPHDTEQLTDRVSSARVSHRPEETVHTTVPVTALRHKSNDGTVSSRTVTRCNGNPPEVTLDRPVEQSQPNILKRDSMPVDAGNDTFVAPKWSRPDKPTSDKRIRTLCNVTNVSNLGNISDAMETDATESDVFSEKDMGVTTTKLPRRRTIKL
jgi:hypothetical protein